MKRICVRCKESKSLDKFYVYGKNISQLCRECNSKSTKSRYNPKKVILADGSKKCSKCKQIKSKEHFSSGMICKSCKVNSYLLHKYGISLSEFESILQDQNGKCAICSKKFEVKQGYNHQSGICVDHDHKTNKVRGLLCHSCNTGLGKLQDDIQILQKSIIYLNKYL